MAEKTRFPDEGTGWMTETHIRYPKNKITNTDARCQRTLLRLHSKGFGRVRIVKQCNLFGDESDEDKYHRLAVIDSKDKLLAELQYSNEKLEGKKHIRIDHLFSEAEDHGLASSLISMLCNIVPGTPKTLYTRYGKRPLYVRLGFVPTGVCRMQLDEDRLAPQKWANTNRKIFIK